MKKENSSPTGNQLPTKKKFRIPYQNIIVGAAAFAYFLSCAAGRIQSNRQNDYRWKRASTCPSARAIKLGGASQNVHATRRKRHIHHPAEFH